MATYVESYEFVQYDGTNETACATALGGTAIQNGSNWYVVKAPLIYGGNEIGQAVQLFENRYYGRKLGNGNDTFIVTSDLSPYVQV